MAITKEEAFKQGIDLKTLEEEDITIEELVSNQKRADKEPYYLVEWSNEPKYYYKEYAK